jgi:hypothetical protein
VAQLLLAWGASGRHLNDTDETPAACVQDEVGAAGRPRDAAVDGELSWLKALLLQAEEEEEG